MKRVILSGTHGLIVSVEAEGPAVVLAVQTSPKRGVILSEGTHSLIVSAEVEGPAVAVAVGLTPSF